MFLAQQAVRSYGGSIQVQSELGKGQHVQGRLERERARPETNRAPRWLAGPKPRAARILVIDDEREVGQAVAAMLETEHEVSTVEHGADALTLLRKGRFDLVLVT